MKSQTIVALLLSAVMVSACGSDGTDNGKAISSVEISPDRDTLSAGASQQYQATARYADGSSKDVSSDSVWNTNDSNLATVSKTGLVSAIKAGVVDITAEYKGVKGDEHFIITP